MSKNFTSDLFLTNVILVFFFFSILHLHLSSLVHYILFWGFWFGLGWVFFLFCPPIYYSLLCYPILSFLLRDVRSGHLDWLVWARTPPACLLEPSPVPGDLGFLPRLQNATATFLFAKHLSQGHTHAGTHRTLTLLVTETATEEALPSKTHTYRTHVKQTKTAKSHPPLSGSWDIVPISWVFYGEVAPS